MVKVEHSNELQALRGLAALCVLVHHALRILGPVKWAEWVAEVLLNAHAAVVIFFVLSGFVLSKSLLSRGFNRDELFGYYIRRIFRIYPALWASCTLGLLYFAFVRSIPAPHFASWAAAHYDPSVFNVRTLLLSYLALFPFLDPPLWTILVELACSAMLPALLFLFLRKRWTIVPSLALLALATFAEQHSIRGILTNFFHFGLGAAIALLGTQRMSRGWPVWLALTVLVFFRQLYPWTYNAAVPSLIEGLMAAMVISGIINGSFHALSHSWLQRLGDISYSVYLLHLPIAYATARVLDFYVFGPELPQSGPLILVVATLLITLPLAALSYRFIELPGVVLGKNILSRDRVRNKFSSPTVP